MAAATLLSCRPLTARNSHHEPAGRDTSNRISAADWLSSAPLVTLHFRLEAHASCSQPAHREPRVVGSHRLPRHANQPPLRRCRRKRPGWQRGWCRVGQPSPKHPPLRSPSVLGLPLSGLFGHLWDGCHGNRRLFVTSNAASGIPVRIIEARNAPHPVSPTSGTERTEGALPPTSLVVRQRAYALSRTVEPPLVSGLATERTASGRRSRLYPRTARLTRASVVHRASSATRRLSASAT